MGWAWGGGDSLIFLLILNPHFGMQKSLEQSAPMTHGKGFQDMPWPPAPPQFPLPKVTGSPASPGPGFLSHQEWHRTDILRDCSRQPVADTTGISVLKETNQFIAAHVKATGGVVK